MKKETKSKKFLSQREAASFLGVSIPTLAKYRNRFNTQSLRKIILFDVEELTRFKGELLNTTPRN